MVKELAGVDPITHSHEGLDDECLFCGAWDLSSAHTINHSPSCLWVRARQLVDLGLPERHQIKAG